MKQRTFLILLAVSLAAIGVAWWTARGILPHDRVGTNARLFPDLAATINDVTQITLTGAGAKTRVTLERGQTAWGVAERAGYPADWDKVRRLLADFAEATIVEPKTAIAERYPQLGVEDVAAEDAGGVQATLDPGPEGAAGPALIIGKANNAGTGRYVRRPGEAQAYAVSGLFEAPQQIGDWLQKEVLDIAAGRINEVIIRHADGELVHARRQPDDPTNFELVNLPAGRELSSQWAVNALPNSLVKVLIDDVQPRADDPDFGADVTLLFVTEEGLNIELALDKQDEMYWLAIDANAEPTAPPAGSAENSTAAATETAAADGTADTAENSIAAAAESDKTQPDKAPPPPDPVAEAAALKARHQGWYYQIPEYKYNAWAKHLEDMLKSPAEQTDK